MTTRGLPDCSCLAAWIPTFEAMIERSPRLFQLAGDAKASAGFHRGGGSADYEPLSAAELRVARNMGAAAWNRWWRNSDGGTNYHSHLRLNGCPHNAVAQPQVEDLNEGRDGTGPLYDNAGAPDDGPRDGVHWPLRTWRQGIEWAERQMEDDIMANIGQQILTAIEDQTKAIQRGNALAERNRALLLGVARQNLVIARRQVASGKLDQAEHAETQKAIDELEALVAAEQD